MPTLSTYIAFPGNAREAFEFYRATLGGELQLVTYADMPMDGMPFEPKPEAVAHAELTLPGGTITGSDVMGDEDYPIRDSAYSLLYSFGTAEEARTMFDALVAGGGSVNMPFEPAPWGGHYGQVFDKFGVMWAIGTDTGEGAPA